MELFYVYFIFKSKNTINTNFLAFFHFFKSKFTPLDPDPGGKMNVDPYGAGSRALVFSFSFMVFFYVFFQYFVNTTEPLPAKYLDWGERRCGMASD